MPSCLRDQTWLVYAPLSVLLWTLGLLSVGSTAVVAQAVPAAPTQPFAVFVTPKGTSATRGANTTGQTQNFTVRNDGLNADFYVLTCSKSGPVTCGSVSPSTVSLASNASATVQVSYSLGAAGSGQIALRATSDAPVADSGWVNLSIVAAPSVSLVAPVLTSGSRALVRGHQPIIRALFSTQGVLDTTATVLRWDGVDVTDLARHNYALLEWEVDSAHALTVGDSAQIQVTACNTFGSCTTVSRWAVLLNDQKPLVSFGGMPLEALGSGFSGPFGPGLSVSQAELETSIGIPSYTSMGVARSAGLVYSTRTSYPRALVAVDLELPWPTTGTPDQLKVVLLDGVARLDSLVVANANCSTGASLKRCRATLQGDFSAQTFPTPVRKWLTVEASVTDAGSTKMGSDSVEVVLVDRRNTPYGAGWWPAGVYQLVEAGLDKLLVAPSGSATVYRGNDFGFVPPPGNFVALSVVGTGWQLRARGSLATVTFDASGRQIVSVDQNGNRDSVAYSGATNQVTKFVDPMGKAITLAYDANGNLSTFTDPGGRKSKVTVAAATNQLTYDSVASLSTAPQTTRFLYQTYPGSNTVVLKRTIGVITDTTFVIYDSTFRRRPVQVRLPMVQDETGADVRPLVSYTAMERRTVGILRSLDSVYVEMQDPLGHWTHSLLNRWGQPVRSWDQIGLLSRASYDPEGLPLWSEGKAGDSSRVYHAYDTARRLVKTWIVRGGGGVHRTDSLVYDASHRVVKHIDARDKVDSITYDVKGNVISTRDPAGKVARMGYRGDGLADSVQARGETTWRTFTYEGTWSNVFEAFDENGELVARHAYDEVGRDTTVESKVRVKRTSTVNEWQWRRTRVFFNLLNQADSTLLQKSDGCADPCSSPPPWTLAKFLNFRRARFWYDRAGRDSLRMNNSGEAALTLRDRLGRVVSTRPWTDSMAVKDSMVYDIAGNLVKTITRRGHVITTDYDTRNRDTLTVVPTVGTIRKAYGGAADQLTRIWSTGPVDSIGGVNAEIRLGYDTRGRLRADTAYTGSTVRRNTYGYDTFERPSTLTDPSGTWTTKYEAQLNRPDMLITPFADTLDWTTDPQGRPTGTTVKSAGPLQAVTQGWLATGELNTRIHSVGGTFTAGKYQRADIDPDILGPALGPLWTEQHGAGAVDTLSDSLEYDGWERVVDWVGLKNGAVIGQESYAFGLNGNVSASGVSLLYDATTDRLTQSTMGGVTRTYVYDRAGNLVQVKEGVTVVFEYGYDALNRLVSMRRLGVLMSRYGYDLTGRRIAKRVYNSASGGTVGYTRFVYQGDEIAFETDSAGTTGLRFTWDRGTDRLAGVRDAAGIQYYAVTDLLGSVRGLVKQNGTWSMSQRFGPYGAVLARDTVSGVPAVKLRFAWTGREFDAETGWYYHRARYYSPELRRFVQEDPGGDVGGPNRYAYVDGRVMEMIDPDGRVSVCAEGMSCVGGGSNGLVTSSPLAGILALGFGPGPSFQDQLLAQTYAQFEYNMQSQVVVTYSSGAVVTYRFAPNTRTMQTLVQHYSAQLVPSTSVEFGPITPVASAANDIKFPWEQIWRIAVAVTTLAKSFGGYGPSQIETSRVTLDLPSRGGAPLRNFPSELPRPPEPIRVNMPSLRPGIAADAGTTGLRAAAGAGMPWWSMIGWAASGLFFTSDYYDPTR